jgi:protein-S-isoprenylcysteine O-methyltransferase Ste14
MTLDPHLVVRSASVYLAVIATLAVWRWRRPSGPAIAGALLAAIWNLPMVLALHVAASEFGWWSFEASGGLVLGMPIDLWLAWAWLWGAVPALAFPRLSIARVVAIAVAFDLVAMPAAQPVVRLGSTWLIGEGVAVLLCLLPAQLLARWTAHARHLEARAVLQMIAFAALVGGLLPTLVIHASGSEWVSPLDREGWQLALMVQILALPAALGLSAVQEFVERGRGTPVPFDPPERLVTTGIYAFVRNPMQLSATLLLCLLGLFLENAWIAASGVMAHIYSVGLAGSDEDEDLVKRFGPAWSAYRRAVRAWIPRFRPWYRSDSVVARLYVASRCDRCRQVGEWFAIRGARGLSIVPAESHPSGSLSRVTYEPADGSPSASGVEAFARALEHIHIGWALLGTLLRLPALRPLVQLLADASGAEPRRFARVDLANPRSTCK